MKNIILPFVVLVSNVAYAQSPATSVPSEPTEVTAPAQGAQAAAPAIAQGVSSAPGLKWAGDLRYRFNRQHEAVEDYRISHQLRARLGVTATVTEDTSAIFRLATGTSAISTNQTLGDSSAPGMPRRNFGIDWAYANWKAAPSFNVWLGRTPNVFWSPAKTQTVYDVDVAFEGLALKFEPKWSNSSLFLNAAANIVSENFGSFGSTPSGDQVDTGLVGLQVGYSLEIFGTWTAHVATHEVINIQGRSITSVESGARIDPYSANPSERYRGNTVFPNDPAAPPASLRYLFRNEYSLVEAGLEWKNKWTTFETSLFGDYVQNTKAESGKTAYELGGSIKLDKFTLSHAWVLKESDSVFAAFTESDTGGGGTDYNGTRSAIAYAANKNTLFQLTQFAAKRGLSARTRDFDYTQWDMVLSF